MTENPWIEWNGGECPVEPDTMVKWQLRFESRKDAAVGRPIPASELGWGRFPDHEDAEIIAYRVVQP